MPRSTDFRSCPEKELHYYLGVESVELIGKLTGKAWESDEYLGIKNNLYSYVYLTNYPQS